MTPQNAQNESNLTSFFTAVAENSDKLEQLTTTLRLARQRKEEEERKDTELRQQLEDMAEDSGLNLLLRAMETLPKADDSGCNYFAPTKEYDKDKKVLHIYIGQKSPYLYAHMQIDISKDNITCKAQPFDYDTRSTLFKNLGDRYLQTATKFKEQAQEAKARGETFPLNDKIDEPVSQYNTESKTIVEGTTTTHKNMKDVMEGPLAYFIRYVLSDDRIAALEQKVADLKAGITEAPKAQEQAPAQTPVKKPFFKRILGR